MGKLQNAKIRSACMRMNDQDILELMVCVDFSDSGSGVVEGHHALYLPPSWKHHTQKSLLGHVIWNWLNVTDSKSIDDMVGKVVRIEVEGMYTVPIRVGHAIKDDRWFCTSDICKANEVQP